MRRTDKPRGLTLSNSLVNLASIIMGVVAAWFLTIQSLKIELAAKAEGVVVETLDKKMATLEVILTEGTVSRDQFYEFSKNTEARLARIELYLSQTTGDKSEQNHATER